MKIEFTHLPKFPEYLLSIEKNGFKYDIGISKSTFRDDEVRIEVISGLPGKRIGSYLHVSKAFLNEEFASDHIIEEYEIAKRTILNKIR